jgi:hypothetical protein
MEEVAPEDWAERVFQPDIVQNADILYKKPGYTMEKWIRRIRLRGARGDSVF